MTARHTNLLLLAILLVGLSGVGISLVALETRKPVGPPVMIVRVVRAVAVPLAVAEAGAASDRSTGDE